MQSVCSQHTCQPNDPATGIIPILAQTMAQGMCSLCQISACKVCLPAALRSAAALILACAIIYLLVA
ncbi:hypothetical protein CQ12_40280 [Bradyrhizobium jicamae]|uniref:Uncharacterized protein n=1 Tax=Bradyrhizobium jicamae TaxID=280332 RepID=A0A0R3LTJ1_9BRAD|nr:hypothetical protein CQ12_40280 [Bradyrhizobium jicamae]